MNLSDIEIRGLRSILKRLRDSELIIMKTDKSGKFCIVSIEDYLRMGQDHISKDKEIGRLEVIEIDKLLNGQVRCQSLRIHQIYIFCMKTTKVNQARRDRL